MSPGPDRSLEERILVLAPTGRDARLTRDTLQRAGVTAQVCADMRELCSGLQAGAGALLIAEEALTHAGLAELTTCLRAQPPWSDVPLIISTGTGEAMETRVRAFSVLEPSGNVTILDRPVRIFTLVTTVQTALRARRRQYQMRDLHQQLQSKKSALEQERELRARFVSLLAHDLRGPVSAASIAAQILIRTPERLDERRELGVRIKKNLDRLEQMVRDLLDASRVQAGQPLPLRLDHCDLALIAQDVVEELNHMNGDRIRLDAPNEVPGIWSAEELRRAIWNLTTNALKYGSPGTPVDVRIQREPERVRLSVHNVGRPLSPDDQRRLFEPFSRTRTAETSAQIGWGLGLTLVRGCVEAHGGRVTVESSPEAGTTFSLEVPLDARPFQPRIEPTPGTTTG